MEQTSYKVDHTKLRRGIYVSRKARIDDVCITSIEIRMEQPNTGLLMPMAVHTIQHLAEAFFSKRDDLLYFGPMASLTGFYMLLCGDYKSSDVVATVTALFKYISTYDGEVPHANEKDCGCYNIHNLFYARKEAHEFLNEILLHLTPENLNYPL